MTGILNILAGALGVAKDTYFNLVSLLLPGNGTNGAQNNTFLDSSTNNFTITRNGNTTQGTFSPFSQTGWGNYFDGTDSLYGTTAVVPATTAFTLEMWVYISGSGENQFFAQYSSGTSGRFILTFSATSYTDRFSFSTSAGVAISSTGTYARNAWHHVAIGRDGSNNWAIWVNGTRDGTNSFSISLEQRLPVIGHYVNTGTTGGLNGYISNLRVITSDYYGVGNSTISVPTSPLTAVSGTVLLTCQSNRFVDNKASSPQTLTPQGETSVVAFSPFAPTAAYTTAAVGGSGYFDGTGDYLGFSDTSILNFGTSAYTVEFWVYQTTTPSDFKIVLANSNFTLFISTGNTIQLWNGASAVLQATQTLINNSWNFVQLIRTGTGANQTTVYVNGTSYTGTDATNWGSSSGSVGWLSGAASTRYFFGYLADLRITKSAVTAAVPTAPLTAITNTSLLFNFTNAGITDATAKNDLETVGNAQISTTQSKWGGGSISFDGTGDYLYSISKPTTSLEGDFTIEFWLYRNVSGNTPIFTLGDSFTANGFEIYIGTSGTQLIVFSGNASRITSSTLPSVTTWAYLAVTRSGSTVTLYLNGTSLGTWSSSSTFSGAVYVGTEFYNGSVNGSLNGYIDDLRITKGYARTVTTTPTAPFPVQ